MRGLLQIQQPIVIGLAVGFLLHTTPAVADTAISKGGLQIKSEDGQFEAKLGGRINLDAIYFIRIAVKPRGLARGYKAAIR